MGTNHENTAGEFILSPFESDAIGEVMNISMGSAATAVSQMLDKQVEITTPTVSVSRVENIKFEKLEPALMVKIVYTQGLTGSNVMVFRQHDMQMILNTLMGIPDPPSDDFVFDDLSISAACEVMNQMMGSSATALADFLNDKVDISTPSAQVMSHDHSFLEWIDLSPDTEVVTITFRLSIKDMLDSEFVSVMTTDLVKNILNRFIGKDGDVRMLEDPAPAEAPAPAPQPVAAAPPPVQQPVMAQPQQPVMQQPMAQPQQMYAQQPAPMMYAPQPQMYMPAPQPMAVDPVNVRPVEFPEFAAPGYMDGTPIMGNNLDLIMNVPLEVSIEIGTTSRKIRDIMNFTSGTVIELNKQAGAPVDVVVNGQLIAHGDVVVIDDNFGVRITEIVGTKALLNSLGGQQDA